ncbi:4'-phosphopantetheinyl transferase superfamily protein [Streptosporangium sp. NPDC051023]|uniref:4'-phosphopantetheinyl transferase family protein n=1 Tax=Streptosporangium sp. NPDC051023 TaxID=3155410 RepID=UPI00344FD7FA
MIEKILPPDVRVAEVFDDDQPAPLFPEEEALVTHSTDKRRREFATVRACARRALGELGLPPVALTRGRNGAPRWPSGVVGSMTHCRGYRAAVVARTGALASIGIDAEPARPLPHGVLGMVTRQDERATLSRLEEDMPGIHWDRLIFSAKEAVYKAWFPLTERWLGFTDAVVEIDPGGAFTARVLLPDSPALGRDGFRGSWLACDGFLLTAVTVDPVRSGAK